MTVGLWGCADSCRAAVAFPDVVMFPIHYAAPRTPPRTSRPAQPSSRGSSHSNSSSSASPPSPPVSPLLPTAGAMVGGGFFRLDVATPPLSTRATSTPGPGAAPGLGAALCPASPGTPESLRPHLRHASTPPPTSAGVVVAEDIPLHAASRAFRPEELHAAAGSDPPSTPGSEDRLQLRLSAEGHLDVDAEATPRWVRRVRLAYDCHSANVQLQVDVQARGSRRGAGRAQCRVRAVRPLSRGQDVQMWFADDLLTCLRLPFLAPHNIQGEKRYVCHHCGRTFEFPNPLKLHLSLDCGREAVTELWRRLRRLGEEEDDEEEAKALDQSRGARRKDTSAFRPYWTPASNTSNDSGVSSLSRMSSSLNGSLGLNGSLNGSHAGNGHASPAPAHAPGHAPSHAPSHAHASGPGLFGAFHHWALSSPALRPGLPNLPLPSLSPAHHHPLLPRPLPPPPENLGLGGLLGNHVMAGARVRDAAPPHAQQAHQASYHQHASDMETLVSNLGRSKQGHLCIYCGKVYSRKYGLKIHIRTHTGFKPLKCKYCLRPFGDPSNLNKHVRLHAEGDTPYKCDLCGKVLVRRRDLERHVKSRHQEGHQEGDWDSNEMDTDNDNDDVEDDVDVEVDVGEEGKSHDEEEEQQQQALHCNGNSLRKQQRERECGRASDIAIPIA